MKIKCIYLYFLLLTSCASMVNFSEAEYVIEVFEDLPGSQDELYLKANNWMIETFDNAESVIQHSDKDGGVIIGKYLMFGKVSVGTYGGGDFRVYAIIDIRVKDNKARVEVKPQGAWQYDESGMSMFSFSKEDAIIEMNELARKLHQSLSKRTVKF